MIRAVLARNRFSAINALREHDPTRSPHAIIVIPTDDLLIAEERLQGLQLHADEVLEAPDAHEGRAYFETKWAVEQRTGEQPVDTAGDIAGGGQPPPRTASQQRPSD